MPWRLGMTVGRGAGRCVSPAAPYPGWGPDADAPAACTAKQGAG